MAENPLGQFYFVHEDDVERRTMRMLFRDLKWDQVAAANPGTIRIEDSSGTILWQKDAAQ